MGSKGLFPITAGIIGMSLGAFKNGEFYEGINAAVDAMMAATKGNIKERKREDSPMGSFHFIVTGRHDHPQLLPAGTPRGQRRYWGGGRSSRRRFGERLGGRSGGAAALRQGGSFGGGAEAGGGPLTTKSEFRRPVQVSGDNATQAIGNSEKSAIPALASVNDLHALSSWRCLVAPPGQSPAGVQHGDVTLSHPQERLPHG
jgi:hypothetical protein